MLIKVNGKALEIAAPTLAVLLAELGFEQANVATALNENFVRAADRLQTQLKPGDAVVFLVPRQGG